MKQPKKIAPIAASVLALGLLTAPVVAQCASTASYQGKSNTIVDVAKSAGSFKTLLAAAQAAGLVEALQGDGPLTVFAPTDEAFAKLPKGTVESLLKPENRDKLRAILTYHVVPGRLDARHVTSKDGATSLNGQRIDFAAKDGKVMVDNASVVSADVAASNGLIHVIDAVILPSDANIVATAKGAKQFNTLLTAATEAGLAGTLADGGPFTVFAPTDEAFGNLPEGTVANLLKPENRDKLASILKYHVVSGRVYANDAIAAGQADTLAGQKVKIANGGGYVMINDARVVMANLDASNGVIHVIDKVIMPR